MNKVLMIVANAVTIRIADCHYFALFISFHRNSLSNGIGLDVQVICLGHESGMPSGVLRNG